MPDPTLVEFTLAIEEFDVSLLPPDARRRGAGEFNEAVKAYLTGEFLRFGGDASIELDENRIRVGWRPDPQSTDPLAPIIQKLKRREYAAAITLLRIVASVRRDDANLLYNLGMALSDTGKLREAVGHLRRAVTLAPDFTHARVALGIALQRQGENADAMRILKEAVNRDAQNAWAQRNLGACFLNAGRPEEAEACLRRATALDPRDQLAMFGLAEALGNLGRGEEADQAYQKAIEIDEYSSAAEAARAARRNLAGRK